MSKSNKLKKARIGVAVVLGLAVSVVAHRAAALSRAATLWQQSYQLEAKGAFPAAVKVLGQLPNTTRAGYLYAQRSGWLYYLGGKHIQAVAAYRLAISRAPKAVEPRLGLLLPLMALRRWQEAERVARDALKLDAGNQLAGRRLALSLYQLGRFAEAEAVYRSVLASYPSDLDMLSGIGWSRLRQGDQTGARRAFAAVLEIAPRHVSAKTGLAASKAKGKRP